LDKYGNSLTLLLMIKRNNQLASHSCWKPDIYYQKA